MSKIFINCVELHIAIVLTKEEQSSSWCQHVRKDENLTSKQWSVLVFKLRASQREMLLIVHEYFYVGV